MGLANILGAAIKYLPWDRIGSAAIKHAPDLLNKLRDRMAPNEPQTQERHDAALCEHEELQERLDNLEKMIQRQNETIGQLSRKLFALEERLIALQTRIVIVTAITAVTTIIAIGLLFKAFT
jgi:predicted nuclease with TOPRIM domain